MLRRLETAGFLLFHILPIVCHISRHRTKCESADLECLAQCNLNAGYCSACSDCKTTLLEDYDEADNFRRILAGDDASFATSLSTPKSFSTEVCNQTCCPDWCERDELPTCTDEGLNFNAEAENLLLNNLEGLDCNPFCVEETSNLCSRLASTLVTKHGSIKAAYCTGLFMVIWSTGIPDHDVDLQSIPNPPMGRDPDSVFESSYGSFSFSYTYSFSYANIFSNSYSADFTYIHRRRILQAGQPSGGGPDEPGEPPGNDDDVDDNEAEDDNNDEYDEDDNDEDDEDDNDEDGDYNGDDVDDGDDDGASMPTFGPTFPRGNLDPHNGDTYEPPMGPTGSQDNCVVRTMEAQFQVYKIPLIKSASFGFSPAFSPFVGEVGATIPSDISLARARLPAAGAIGILIDGVPIYPSFDNADYAVWEVCEADQCSAHSGRGADYHVHGDPFGVGDACLYSSSDYGNGTHPPLIGFAADGYNIYGRYTEQSQAGVEIELDDCGGHNHTGPYHYHPSVQYGLRSMNEEYFGLNYTAYWISPKYCFAGNVSSQPLFWDAHQWNYDNAFSDFSVNSRSDVGYLRPCCGSVNAYLHETHDENQNLIEIAAIQTVFNESAGFSEFCTSVSAAQVSNIVLACDEESSVIESLTFACFGNPRGSCGYENWEYEGCCAHNSFSAFDACVGETRCSVPVESFLSELPSTCSTASSSRVGKFRGVCKTDPDYEPFSFSFSSSFSWSYFYFNQPFEQSSFSFD